MTNLECNNTVTHEQLAIAATEQAAFFRAMNKTEQANTLQALAQCIRDLLEDKYELQTSYDVLGGVKELLRMEKERLDAEVDDLRRQLAEAQAENDAFRKAWNFEELTKPLKEQLAEAQARLAELAKYFTSGNCVPVERATILAKDFWRICGTKAHSPADQKDAARSQAAADVLAERRRQVEKEGWTPEHDDRHSNCEMACAAAAYAMNAGGTLQGEFPTVWPWDSWWFKPSDSRRDLVKAGALILAEIERLDRAAAPDAAMLAASPGGQVECKCNLRQKLVGDGCHVFNPEYAADHAATPDAPAREPEVTEDMLLAYQVGAASSRAHRAANGLMGAMERLLDSCEECTDFDGFTAQMVSMDDYHEAQEALATAKQIMEGGE